MAVLFGAVGAFEEGSIADGQLAGLAGAWVFGVPLGTALAGLMELGAWERIARREHRSVWISSGIWPTKQDRRTAFVIAESELITVGD
ncbi:MAG TPA: hypothetical protein VMA72_02830 [Streptosporangiaceae bacterium]|nr:hypothetical protein [Streptosporangiaceae bacterium]